MTTSEVIEDPSTDDKLAQRTQERDDAEARIESLTQEWQQQRDRAELLERTVAVTMIDRDDWKSVALNRVGQCTNCIGGGIVQGTDDNGDVRDYPCRGCRGTGRGEVAHAINRMFEQVEAAREDRDNAISAGEGMRAQVAESIGQRDEARKHVERLQLDKREAVAALTEIATVAGVASSAMQIARRALGLLK